MTRMATITVKAYVDGGTVAVQDEHHIRDGDGLAALTTGSTAVCRKLVKSLD